VAGRAAPAGPAVQQALAAQSRQPEAGLQQRGLARAVRADHRQPVAGGHGQRDTVEHQPVPVSGTHRAQFDGRAHHSFSALRRSTMMKNGAPANAVTTPMGSSPGMAVRAIWSATMRNDAPPSSDNGTITR